VSAIPAIIRESTHKTHSLVYTGRYACIVVKRETGHTHKHEQHDTRTHDTRHDKNNTTNDQTKNHPPHLTTIEGGAATVRTASYSCDTSNVYSNRTPGTWACRGTVPYCTSCATFPISAQSKSGTTGTVRHFSSTKQRLSGVRLPVGRKWLTLRQSGERLPESRCFVEEKCRTVPVVPLFL